MDCATCQAGETSAATRPKVVDREGRTAVIRDVPVEVCDNCGEVYIDAAVIKHLDEQFRRMLDGPVDHVIGHFDPAV